MLLHEHSSIQNYLYKLSGKRLVRETSVTLDADISADLRRKWINPQTTHADSVAMVKPRRRRRGRTYTSTSRRLLITGLRCSP